MDKFECDPLILDMFRNGSNSRILNVNNTLLSCEKTGFTPELLKSMRSEVHTLKGDSRMIGLQSISDAAHRIEDYMSEAEKGDPAGHPALIKSIFRLLDAITGAIMVLPEKVIEIDLAGSIGAGPVEREKRDKDGKIPEKEKKESLKDTKNESINLSMNKIEKLVGESGIFPQYFNKFNFIYNKLNAIRELIEAESPDKVFLKEMGAVMYQFSHELAFYDLSSRQFQNQITKLKLVRLSTIFDQFPRLVRDVAGSTGKLIEFAVTGNEVELDKFITENLKTVLIHMLRNAVDHGCEAPGEREKAGKPREGRIQLNAFNRGDNVILELSDDGNGLDIDRIREKAVEKGLITREKAVALTHDEIILYIFESGISTKQVSEFSGRGIGMDVVAKTIKEMNGEIKVKTIPNRGTTFTITVPLISSYIPITVFVLRDHLFGIPSSYIRSVTRIGTEHLKMIGDREFISMSGDTDISLVDTGEFLGLGRNGEERSINVIFVKYQDEMMAFKVSDIVYEKKMQIQKSHWQSEKLKSIIGAVLSGRGRAIPVLNLPELFRKLKNSEIKATHVGSGDLTKESLIMKNVLLVEDSAVTRSMEKDILKGRKLNVFEAANGKEAITLLEKYRFDLIITDIEMPVMNGLDLITYVRQSETLSVLPVIVISSYMDYFEKVTGLGVGGFIDKVKFTPHLLIEALAKVGIIGAV